MKENRVPRLLTLLILGGSCLLLAAGMLLTPLLVDALRGGKTVILPKDAVTKGETEEPIATVPVDGLVAPDIYAPENMFWILQDVDPADIRKASIPEGKKASRSDARLLYQENWMRNLVNVLNHLLPLEAMASSVRLDPSTVEGKARYTLRYGDREQDAVTFYEGGYFSYVGTDHIVDIQTNLGFTLLKSAYDQATTATYFYENGLYELGLVGLWRPATSQLLKGGRAYHIADTVYCYPMTASEAFAFRTTSSQYPLTLYSDDVTYLTELIDAIADNNWIAAVPALSAEGGTARLFRFWEAEEARYDQSGEREALFEYLSLFSDTQALCSVEGEGDGAALVAAKADDFWYFPSMKEDRDSSVLLTHYQDNEDRSALDFAVFHIAAEGVNYYRKLSANEPEYRGLKDFVRTEIPKIPLASEDMTPEELFLLGTGLNKQWFLETTIPNGGAGESLPYEYRILLSVEDMRLVAEIINGFTYREEAPVLLSELKGSRIHLRFGSGPEDVVTVYGERYVSFGTRDYALPTEFDINFTASYSKLWEVFDRAPEQGLAYRNGLRSSADITKKPSTTELAKGGRLYYTNSGEHAYFTLLTEEELAAYRKRQTEAVFSPSVDDVHYMLEVIELAAEKGVKILLPSDQGVRTEVILPDDMNDKDGFYIKRLVLTTWLLSLSQHSTYSVTLLTPPGGTVPETPSFDTFRQTDYWFIPSSSADFDADLFLTHFTETKNREALDFPAFHIHDGGVDYYESLAENAPVRLLGNP